MVEKNYDKTVPFRSGFCSMTDPSQGRLDGIMLQLSRFQIGTSDPKWSSYALDCFFEEAMTAPGGSIRDVYLGLDAVLKTHSVELTGTVAAFIKDVVIRCFTRYRQSYDSVNWKEVVDSLGDQATAAQLYLALHAVPPQFVTPRLADAIAKSLESTAFRDEAASTLAVG
jgi:flavin-binding protein dodecin